MFQQNDAKRVNNQTHGFLKPTRKKHEIELILEKWKQELQNREQPDPLNFASFQHLNLVECVPKIDLDSMLMMQPPPEKKIKMEVEEPLEKVIKIENEINEKVKIKIKEEEAIPCQNFGSTTIFPKTTVISDVELKEVKSESIDEDELEIEPPIIEQKIKLSEIPKEDSTSENLAQKRNSKNRCNVCLELVPYSTLKNVSLLEENMIVLLGMVLDGRLSVHEANCRYTARVKTDLINARPKSLICRQHFHESRQYIYKALGATTADQIFYANEKIVENILEIVKKIQGTPITAVYFVHVMNKFLKRNFRDELKKEPRKYVHRTECCYCRKFCELSEMTRVPKNEDIRLKWYQMLGSGFERNVESVNIPYICRSHFSPGSFSPYERLLKDALPCTMMDQHQARHVSSHN